MKNKKIILLNDKKLFILLNEFLKDEIFFYNLTNNIELDLNEIKKDSYNFAIVDSNVENIYDFLSELKLIGIRVILVGHNINPDILRNCFKQNLIEDYIEKSNYIKIEELLEKDIPKKIKKIIVKNPDLEEVIIELKNLYMISYDRAARRSLFDTNDNEYYFSRKTLSEIEEILSSVNNFLRIERGLIINLDKVYKINPEEGCLIFDNNKKVFYSRSKLKEIKDSILNNVNISQI